MLRSYILFILYTGVLSIATLGLQSKLDTLEARLLDIQQHTSLIGIAPIKIGEAA